MSIIVRIPGGVSMAVEMRYNYLLGAYNEAELHAALAALSPPLPGFLGVGSSSGGVQVVCADVLSAADKTRLDAAMAAYAPAADYLTQRLRAVAQALLSDPQALMKALRAVLLSLIDQLNQIGTQHNALLTWLGAETTLTNRTQLNGFTLPASVTPAQAKTTVANKISSGGADV